MQPALWTTANELRGNIRWKLCYEMRTVWKEMYFYLNGNDRRHRLSFYESGHDGPWWTGVESTAKKRPNGRLKISGREGYGRSFFNGRNFPLKSGSWHFGRTCRCRSFFTRPAGGKGARTANKWAPLQRRSSISQNWPICNSYFPGEWQGKPNPNLIIGQFVGN